MARAIWNGKVIAESDDIVRVEGNTYFPPDAVKPEHLRASETTSVCGWKGTACYHDLLVDGQINKDAAWYYPDPEPEAEHVRGRIAFWRGVRVED